jgi:hypothetical protein
MRPPLNFSRKRAYAPLLTEGGLDIANSTGAVAVFKY